jgi:hypothetical protein
MQYAMKKKEFQKNIFGPIVLVCWQRSLVLPDFTVFDYPTTHEFEHSWNNTQLGETISDGVFILNCSESCKNYVNALQLE